MSQLARVFAPGGRVHIHVTSEGLTRDNGVFPDLRVSLRSQDLHAPLVERMVELPVDITAGARPCSPSTGYLMHLLSALLEFLALTTALL